MPSIILMNKGMEREEFPLGKAILLVGRNPDSEIHLASTEISRNHASIVYDDGHYLIRDNGSTNGTFVNGKEVSKQILAHNDEISFGPYSFLVNLPEDSSLPRQIGGSLAGRRREARTYESSTRLPPVAGSEAAGTLKVMTGGNLVEMPLPKKNPLPLLILTSIGVLAIIAWYLQHDENEVMADRYRNDIAELKRSSAAQIEGLKAELTQAHEALRTSKQDLENTLKQISILQTRKAAEDSPAGTELPTATKTGS